MFHHRSCRRAYSPTSNAASHDNHEKINSWVSFSFLYEYGALLGGPLGHRSSATNLLLTEREGRTGEYWPEVVAVRTERSEVRTKRPRANIPRYGSS